MTEQEPITDRESWWAKGDIPVQDAPRAAFLIDGRMTMLERIPS